MRTARLTLAHLAMLATIVACSNKAAVTNSTGSTGNTGNGRSMTASYNGTTFTPTSLTSGWNAGQTTIGAADGVRVMAIAGLNITAGSTSYSAAPGNVNGLNVTWIDGSDSYSTGFAGSGTLTFSVAQLGRVAGSFNVVAKTVNGSKSITLVGLYDIKYP